MPDIQAAIDYAAQRSGGARWALWVLLGRPADMARCHAHGLSAAVPYYGGGMTTPEEAARQPKVPVLAHFGERDHWIPLDSVQALTAPSPAWKCMCTQADHGFNCDQRGSYDEVAPTRPGDPHAGVFDQAPGLHRPSLRCVAVIQQHWDTIQPETDQRGCKVQPFGLWRFPSSAGSRVFDSVVARSPGG